MQVLHEKFFLSNQISVFLCWSRYVECYQNLMIWWLSNYLKGKLYHFLVFGRFRSCSHQICLIRLGSQSRYNHNCLVCSSWFYCCWVRFQLHKIRNWHLHLQLKGKRLKLEWRWCLCRFETGRYCTGFLGHDEQRRAFQHVFFERKSLGDCFLSHGMSRLQNGIADYSETLWQVFGGGICPDRLYK